MLTLSKAEKLPLSKNLLPGHFQSVRIVVRSTQGHLRQTLATRYAELVTVQLHLFVEQSHFRTRSQISIGQRMEQAEIRPTH